MISKAHLFWADDGLVALSPSGEMTPIVQEFEPEYKNVSRSMEWRLRDGSKPELGDGTLIANAVKIGHKLTLQFCLTSGKTTVIPNDDGFLFVLKGELVPSVFAIDYHLGGIGTVFMNSRDNGTMAGSYFGMARLVKKVIDGIEVPGVAVYFDENTPLSHLTPVTAAKPFSWRTATEGGNWLSVVIEYEI